MSTEPVTVMLQDREVTTSWVHPRIHNKSWEQMHNILFYGEIRVMDFPGCLNFLLTAKKTQNTLASSFLSFQLNLTKQSPGPFPQKWP